MISIERSLWPTPCRDCERRLSESVAKKSLDLVKIDIQDTGNAATCSLVRCGVATTFRNFLFVVIQRFFNRFPNWLRLLWLVKLMN